MFPLCGETRHPWTNEEGLRNATGTPLHKICSRFLTATATTTTAFVAGA